MLRCCDNWSFYLASTPTTKSSAEITHYAHNTHVRKIRSVIRLDLISIKAPKIIRNIPIVPILVEIGLRQEYFIGQSIKPGPLTCVRISNADFARYVSLLNYHIKSMGSIIQNASIGYRIAYPQNSKSHRTIRQLQTQTARCAVWSARKLFQRYPSLLN